MSRRSKRKHQTSPSLFPFLAVLICTMGAIIVLLVLVVKRADVQADAATQTNQEELADKKEQLNDQLELETGQVDTLKELRPDLKDRLEIEKTAFGHLSDHVSRLKKEFEQLRSDYARITRQASAEQSSTDLSAKVDELQQRILLARAELETRKKEVAGQKPAYAIIPHAKGGSGTFRRPIFVECDGQGVTLQPYGITLKSNDFPKSMGPNNPLDTALLMIRDYWNQLDPNQTDGQPYPLFVVRPSGSKSFAAARKAMKSWVDEFGYELVTADIELQYPDVDKNFAQRLKQSVEISRIRQQNAVATINRQQALSQIRRLENQGGRGAQGFRASSLNGGFVQEGTGQTAGQTRTNPVTQFAKSSSQDNRFSTGNGSSFNNPLTQSGLNQEANRSSQSGTRSSSFQPPGSQAQNSFGGSTDAGGQGSGSQTQNSSASSGNGVPSLPPESLAVSRGKDWALPSKANNSIQVRKPIKVVVGRNEIRIVELGKGVKSIPFGKSTAGAVPGLIEQVWKHIDAWGIAGVNSYWKPTLNMYVAPDAQNRFSDLQILLSGSGLDLRRTQ